MKKHFLSLVFCCAAAMGSPFQATAAEPLVLEGIVVSAPREETEGKRIDAKALRTHSVTDLAEVISDEMVEATMIRKSGYGNEVSIRGFSKDNLRVVIDGGILEGACGSRKDPSLSHVNLLMVDRIEVRQGPFEVTRNGGLGGGINVVTHDPEPGFHGEVLPRVGSHGFLGMGGYVTGGNDTIQGLLGYNYSESDQYEDGDGNELHTFANPGNAYNAEGRDANAFQKNDLWGKIRYAPADNQELLFSYIFGLAEDILTPRVAFDTEEEETHLLNLDYTLTDLGPASESLTVTAYYNHIRHIPSTALREAGPPLKNDVVSIVAGGGVENRHPTDFARFIYGADFYRRTWQGDQFNRFTGAMFNDEFVPDTVADNYGLYAQAEKEIGDWFVSAGIRGDLHETEADEPLPNSQARLGTETNARSDTEFSGFVKGRYAVTSRLAFFGGIGRSVRFPNCVERYLQPPRPANFAGNPDLDPSRNTEVDLGVEYNGDRFRFQTKAFYSDIADYIYQQGGEGQTRTWVNIDATIYGIDARGAVDLGADFTLEGGAAIQVGEKDSFPANNFDKDLADIPPLKTRLALVYDGNPVFGTLEWIHSEENDEIDEAAGEQALSGWDVVNFRLGWDIRPDLTLTAGVDNLFDKRYAVANSYEFDVVSGTGANPPVVYEPGRAFYGTLSFVF